MLAEDVKNALTKAMVAKESERVLALRMIVASLHNEKIAKRRDLSDDEAIEVLKRELKKCEEALGIYKNAGRSDKAKEEEMGIEVIKSFLPEALSEEELKTIVDRVFKDAGESPRFGDVMKLVMAEAKGRGDGAKISSIIKERLSP